MSLISTLFLPQNGSFAAPAAQSAAAAAAGTGAVTGLNLTSQTAQGGAPSFETLLAEAGASEATLALLTSSPDTAQAPLLQTVTAEEAALAAELLPGKATGTALAETLTALTSPTTTSNTQAVSTNAAASALATQTQAAASHAAPQGGAVAVAANTALPLASHGATAAQQTDLTSEQQTLLQTTEKLAGLQQKLTQAPATAENVQQALPPDHILAKIAKASDGSTAVKSGAEAEAALQQKAADVYGNVKASTEGLFASSGENGKPSTAPSTLGFTTSATPTLTADGAETIHTMHLAPVNAAAKQALPTAQAEALPGTYNAQAQQKPAAPSVQISAQFARLTANPTQRIEVQLEPANLGKVHIQLDMPHEGKATVAIVADRAETLELLQRDARALERSLQEAGVKADSSSMQFSLKEHSNQQTGQQFAGGKGNPQVTNDAPAITTNAQATAAYLISDNLLDIHV